MYEYQFSYDSWRVGELWSDDHAVTVDVTVEFNVEQTRAYDSPLGPLGKRPSVADVKPTSVWAANHDLMSLLENDKEFEAEISLEMSRRELAMLERVL